MKNSLTILVFSLLTIITISCQSETKNTASEGNSSKSVASASTPAATPAPVTETPAAYTTKTEGMTDEAPAVPAEPAMATKSGDNMDAKEMAAKKSQTDKMKETMTEKKGEMKEMADAKVAEAKEMAAKTLDSLKSQQTVYFDFDRSTIKADFMPILNKHAEYLVANSNQRITIEGHCDSRGTPEYNIALGERRAKAVQEYLTNAGVSSSQVSVVSYGEEKLAVMGATEYAMAQNRRGVVVYN